MNIEKLNNLLNEIGQEIYDLSPEEEWAKENREIRKDYLDGSKRLEKEIKEMESQNMPKEDIARKVVEVRNQEKVKARARMKPDEVKVLEERNMKKYKNPIGPTADDLFKKSKDDMIEKGKYESDEQVWGGIIKKR